MVRFAQSHTWDAKRSRIHLKIKSFIRIVALLTVLGIGELSTNLAISADRPKIALALAGGGARGGAHIWVLQLLEELSGPLVPNQRNIQ